MKLGDEIVELKQLGRGAVLRGTQEATRAGPNGLGIIVIGAPNRGEAPREEVEGPRDWWARRQGVRRRTAKAAINEADERFTGA
jgi:hypothetical protein